MPGSLKDPRTDRDAPPRRLARVGGRDPGVDDLKAESHNRNNSDTVRIFEALSMTALNSS